MRWVGGRRKARRRERKAYFETLKVDVRECKGEDKE